MIATTTMNPCAICGYDNVPNTLFCEECGATLAPPVTPSPSRPSNPPVALATEQPATGEAGEAGEAGGVGAATAATDQDGMANAEERRDTRPTAPAAVAPAAPAAPAAPVAPLMDSPDMRSTTASLISETGRRLEIPAQDVVIVGREDMRSGIRPDVDLTLDGASAAGVSRRHCRLLRGADGWRVEDLMSTNYTVLNGKALPAHTPAPVRDGDELRLGKLRLRFHER